MLESGRENQVCYASRFCLVISQENTAVLADGGRKRVLGAFLDLHMQAAAL
jgi:hypothetical protein